MQAEMTLDNEMTADKAALFPKLRLSEIRVLAPAEFHHTLVQARDDAMVQAFNRCIAVAQKHYEECKARKAGQKLVPLLIHEKANFCLEAFPDKDQTPDTKQVKNAFWISLAMFGAFLLGLAFAHQWGK